eukprot:2862478-Amphidinium_carterae.1
MRADSELGERVLEAERRVLRATEVKAAEERKEELRTTGGVKAAGDRKAGEREDRLRATEVKAAEAERDAVM